MSNGKCGVCGANSSCRAKIIGNGLRKTRELCEDDYVVMRNQAGRSGGFNSPIDYNKFW